MIRTILTVAGSDSASGAGLQADCAAARSQGVLPLCAVSCVTSQNSRGVRMVEPVGMPVFTDQIEAALADVRPGAVKIGMIPGPLHAEELIRILEHENLPNVVLDPILASSKGNADLPAWLSGNLLQRIAPLLTLITPNIPEARRILGLAEGEEISQLRLAERLLDSLDVKAVLLKGGHAEGGDSTDILLTRKGQRLEFTHPRVATPNTHGSGCALSSLIAARLALGDHLSTACLTASDLLYESLHANADTRFYPDAPAGYGPAFFP
ncbi:MAG: hydroxymethylpyrimidine/phosphomethylpyrimidine kinase [Muribaculaceae bacterium]|nr:hydroxymethylpyrimidine/phosphomethylpyrimidine kinase [Muribaculaceae bacterium]